jgi:hypothetical protein
MATKNTAKKTIAAPTQSAAHRMADRFDNSAAAIKADAVKPLAQSRTKQTGIVVGLVGTGFAAGLLLG